uniref:Uncharacterized protein n=1 Tax=Soybean thrips rhabdo-like virus 3 TaxID=2796570 RepID=A0A7T3R0J5_9RHAB|nr:hypothetical protein 1 [Soybean thrips rhabdo-like virus 3]
MEPRLVIASAPKHGASKIPIFWSYRRNKTCELRDNAISRRHSLSSSASSTSDDSHSQGISQIGKFKSLICRRLSRRNLSDPSLAIQPNLLSVMSFQDKVDPAQMKALQEVVNRSEVCFDNVEFENMPATHHSNQASDPGNKQETPSSSGSSIKNKENSKGLKMSDHQLPVVDSHKENKKAEEQSFRKVDKPTTFAVQPTTGNISWYEETEAYNERLKSTGRKFATSIQQEISLDTSSLEHFPPLSNTTANSNDPKDKSSPRKSKNGKTRRDASSSSPPNPSKNRQGSMINTFPKAAILGSSSPKQDKVTHVEGEEVEEMPSPPRQPASTFQLYDPFQATEDEIEPQVSDEPPPDNSAFMEDIQSSPMSSLQGRNLNSMLERLKMTAAKRLNDGGIQTIATIPPLLWPESWSSYLPPKSQLELQTAENELLKLSPYESPKMVKIIEILESMTSLLPLGTSNLVRRVMSWLGPMNSDGRKTLIESLIANLYKNSHEFELILTGVKTGLDSLAIREANLVTVKLEALTDNFQANVRSQINYMSAVESCVKKFEKSAILHANEFESCGTKSHLESMEHLRLKISATEGPKASRATATAHQEEEVVIGNHRPKKTSPERRPDGSYVLMRCKVPTKTIYEPVEDLDGDEANFGKAPKLLSEEEQIEAKLLFQSWCESKFPAYNMRTVENWEARGDINFMEEITNEGELSVPWIEKGSFDLLRKFSVMNSPSAVLAESKTNNGDVFFLRTLTPHALYCAPVRYRSQSLELEVAKSGYISMDIVGNLSPKTRQVVELWHCIIQKINSPYQLIIILCGRLSKMLMAVKKNPGISIEELISLALESIDYEYDWCIKVGVAEG